jgi:glycerol-3-phosphate dehydrogenase subunit C
MLRAKAVKFKKRGAPVRDRLLTSTDAMGKLAAIPVVAQTINAVNRNAAARVVLQSTLGVHRDRELPPYSPRRFRSHAEPSSDFPVRAGERTPGRVAIFATCYVNYNEPGIGHDLLKILEHNEIPHVLVEKEACCGMPKLELGDLDAVEALKKVNIPVLARLAREGYAILTAVPSCTLMYKKELPLIFPADEEVGLVSKAMFDPFEYFVLRKRDGLLKTDFKASLGRVSYHIPCHSRVQNIGQKTRELLEAIPGTQVKTVERCSGHDGTWGVKTEYFANSMKIGRPVFRQMAEDAPDFISSDCPIAGRHIEQGIAESAQHATEGEATGKPTPGEMRKEHPLSLLVRAYQL